MSYGETRCVVVTPISFGLSVNDNLLASVCRFSELLSQSNGEQHTHVHLSVSGYFVCPLLRLTPLPIGRVEGESTQMAKTNQIFF